MGSEAYITQNNAGELILIDPVGAAVANAVNKSNCRVTLDLNADRVSHFKRRMAERNYNGNDVVIVLLNADDTNGRVLADMLMPGHDWQQYRDRGEVPFARGLAGREGIQAALCVIDRDAANKLNAIQGVAVVVVDHGTAEVFE